jgi:hypothetical protein
VTIWRALVFASLCAIAVTVKFSGLPIVLLAIVTLLVHAAITRSARTVVAAISTITVSALLSWLVLWAGYGFHFAPHAGSFGTPGRDLVCERLRQSPAPGATGATGDWR